MRVIGIGGIATSDVACAAVVDGRLVAAVEKKKVPERSALAECLRIAKLDPASVEAVGIARPVDEASLKSLRAQLPSARITLIDHHQAHAASAFFASGFKDATVLTIDSGNDLTSAKIWNAAGTSIAPEREMLWPDSIGDLYSRVTEFLGFKRRADEHKVQWMSAVGDDRFVSAFESILGHPWGSINLADGLHSAIGVAPNAVTASLRPHIAAGVQRAVERYAIAMAGSGKNLCLAGGVFFNALLVRAFETSGNWENVFVQPAAGNSGTAIGAAYSATTDAIQPLETLALGPEFSPEEIKQVLENCKLRFNYLRTTGEVVAAPLKFLIDQKIVAWMQGRMEFGPRALGNRSILASPLDPYSSENLNVYIKHREGFRKFAAAVPAEQVSDYFEVGPNATFLATVGKVRPEHRKTFEGAILGQDLIRIHSVEKAENPLFHRLLVQFGEKTGVPVLYNTSFNLFGDPLVCTPRDAVRSFFSSGIDALVAGNFVLEK